MYKHIIITPSRGLELGVRKNTLFPLIGHRLIPSWSSVAERLKRSSVSRPTKLHRSSRLKLQLLLCSPLKCLSSLFIVLLNHFKRRTDIVQMSFLWLDFCSECGMLGSKRKYLSFHSMRSEK